MLLLRRTLTFSGAIDTEAEVWGLYPLMARKGGALCAAGPRPTPPPIRTGKPSRTDATFSAAGRLRDPEPAVSASVARRLETGLYALER